VSPWKEGNHLEVFWKVCLDSINDYLQYGYDVVFNYIVGVEELEKINHIFSNHEIKFVVLMVNEETLIKRDKERPLDWQMGERCIVLLNSFKNKGYSENNLLDTSKLNVDETVEKIIKEKIAKLRNTLKEYDSRFKRV
jgi:chloramphenicol 3-O-phosphotransferase